MNKNKNKQHQTLMLLLFFAGIYIAIMSVYLSSDSRVPFLIGAVISTILFSLADEFRIKMAESKSAELSQRIRGGRYIKRSLFLIIVLFLSKPPIVSIDEVENVESLSGIDVANLSETSVPIGVYDLKIEDNNTVVGFIKNNSEYDISASMEIQTFDVNGNFIKTNTFEFGKYGDRLAPGDIEKINSYIWSDEISYSATILSITANSYSTELVKNHNIGFFIIWLVALIAIILFVIAINLINLKKRQCYSFIINSNVTSLDEIAAHLQMSYDKTHLLVRNMSDKGFFGEAVIDLSKRKIQLSSTENSATDMKSVTCPSCGATCEVHSNKNNFCEYCGNALSLGK